MNKIDYRIKGTKIPELPNNIEFKTLFWANFKHAEFYFNKIKQSDLISYGYIKHENEDCILVEKENYDGKNYWIFKESDLINLTKDMNKQNNLPKYWVVKNTNNDDFKVVIDYLNSIMNTAFWVGRTYIYYGYDGSSGQRGTNGWDILQAFQNNPTLLTLEEFKRAIGIEEDFVLPEKWCVRITEENKETFRQNNINSMCYVNSVIERYFCCDKYQFKWYSSNIYGIEITFEQFKKYVLKQNNMENNKKIIGYKLIKREYEEACIKLAVDCYCDFDINFDTNTTAVKLWEKAGVLDLWFEPIYEEEVKTINMGSFNLTVKDKKVFHNNEDITDFVVAMSKYRILQNLGRYTARIEEINFGSTGCECNPTKLSDWLKVYDMIK